MSPRNEWIPFIPALLLGLAAAIGLIWLILRHRGGVSDASCGYCGYLVVGLTTPICPECGHDLSEVGIRMPGDAWPMPCLLRADLFTLIYLAIVMLAWPVLKPLLPRRYSATTSVEMAYPRSDAFHSVIALASGSGWAEQVAFDHVDLTIVPRGGAPRMLSVEIEPEHSNRAMEFSRADEQTITLRDIRDLTPEMVFGWITNFAGPSSRELQNEAASISAETIKLASAEIQIQRTTPDHTPFGSLTFRQASAIPLLPWRVIVPVSLVAIVGWLIGVGLVYRRVDRVEVVHG